MHKTGSSFARRDHGGPKIFSRRWARGEPYAGDVRKRVLIVTNYFMPHVGGLEEVVAKQANSLAGKGYAVTVITCRPAGNVPTFETIHAGVKVVRVAAWNGLDRRFGLPFPLISPISLFLVLKYARSSDIVHVHDLLYPLCQVGALAAAITRRPIFVTQHVAVVDHPKRLVMWLQMAIYFTIGRLILRRCHKAVAYNRHVEAHLRRSGVAAERILRMGNGIDTDLFSPPTTADRIALRRKFGLDPNVPVVLFVGRLVPKKGFQILVQSVTSHKCLKVIAGGGDIPLPLRDRPDTVFMGSQTQQSVRDLYRMSDVFVFPATSEVFTLVMQEAMASGLPVVTTADVAYLEAGISEQHVRLVDRTPEAVGQAIDEIISSRSRRAEMATYSREYALQHFNWDSNFELEAGAYAELLGTS